MRYRIVLCTLLTLSACQSPETPEQASARMAAESATAKAEVDAINIRYARYMNGNHADSVAMLFMDNGVLMPPFTLPVTGRDNIRQFLSTNGLPPGSSLTFTAVDVTANGPLMIERGAYTFTMAAQGDSPAVNIPGKYLSHWHKVDGTWLQAASTWSDDVAPPAATP